MKSWAMALRLVGLGWYVSVCILLGVLVGLWLDDKVNTRILFTLLGLGIGLVAAFWGTYRMLFFEGDGHQDKDKEKKS
ncbi:MAG: AtpZ/AtpI family protein [Chloroflexi bacterium]|nr:AtpZ/AtpI family protein [Chloroflexota bacterium]